jgi:GNAT superfamily N-acetyltransferase
MTYVYSQDQHGHLVPYMAALHASCISLDGMVGPFLPPLTNEKLLPWWRERIAEANRGSRIIVLLLGPPSEASLPMTPGVGINLMTTAANAKKPLGTDLRGLAMLKLSESETGSFRARIDTVLVDRRHRRQGGARALVAALEYEAAKRGRSLLVSNPVLSGESSIKFNRTNSLPRSSSAQRRIASPRLSSRSLDTLR